MDAFRQRILDFAGDESPLWDVRLPLFHLSGGLEVELYPEAAVDQLRPALEQALGEGLVELREIYGAAGLSHDDALVVLRDEVNWYSPDALGTAEPREQIYCLVLTDHGRDVVLEEQSEPACYLTRLGTD